MQMKKKLLMLHKKKADSGAYDKLAALVKSLPPFPESIRSNDANFREYKMEEGTCFAWHLYEAEPVGVHRWFNSKDTIFPVHSHPQDEWIFVYTGRVRFDLGEDQVIVSAGQMHNNPPNVIHGATFLADTKYISIMYPPSKDYPHGKEAK